MKKIVALVLCLVLALSLCTTAMAADKLVWNTLDSVYDLYVGGTKWSEGGDSGAHLKYAAANAPIYKDKTVAFDGNVAVYMYDGTAADLFYVETKDSTKADAYLVADGTADAKLADATKIYLKVAVSDGMYQYAAQKFTNFGEACGQIDPTDSDDTYLTWTNAAGVAQYGIKDSTGTAGYVFYDGEVVAYKAAEDVNPHTWTASAWNKTTGAVTKYTCSSCKVSGDVYDAEWKIPAGYVGHAVPGGFVAIAKTATGSTTTVESAKTFDAGIALYAGMALASVAGSAVVIGKKKEF